MVPNSSEGVVTQLPKLFEDRVGLRASGLFVGVGVGSSNEARLGGQALVVDLRYSLSHDERYGVRHIEEFDSRYKAAESPPAGRSDRCGREEGINV